MTTATDALPAIEIQDIAVHYRIPSDRIRSFKEYVLERLARHVEYSDLWALRGVSLSIQKGEAFGIVGRNGSGKSTLLKVISRVLYPTEGRVIVRGRLAPLLELGAGFHPDLTGRENFFLNSSLLGYPAEGLEELLPEVVAFAELEGFINAPIRTYSSGMKARLGFAVATLYRPDILVLDEVLAVGDLHFRKKCLERLNAFRELGTTFLLVSHSLDIVEGSCDRAAWIDGGKIAALGSTDEVLPRYQEALTGSD